MADNFDYLNRDLGDDNLVGQILEEEEYKEPENIEEILAEASKSGTEIVLVIMKNDKEQVVEPLEGVVAHIERNYDLVKIDIYNPQFPVYAQRFVDRLDEFSLLLQEAMRDDDMTTSLTLFLTPEKYLGNIVLAASNPFYWGVCADKIGEQANIVRLIFTVNDIEAFTTNED